MEPLPSVSGRLTPPGVEVALYDDRMEEIPFDEPTDWCDHGRDLHGPARL